jgi:hypothetical protein
LETGRARRSLGSTLLLATTVTLVGAATAAVSPQALAAGDVTSLFIDPEPNPVVTYEGSHKSFVYERSDLNKVDVGNEGRQLVWLQYEPLPDIPAAMGSWSVGFAAPPGHALAVGDYPGAVQIRYQDAGEPGLGVQGGPYCLEATGRFTIHELEMTASKLLALSATFRYRCQEGSPPFHPAGMPGWVYGEVRYNASDGYRAASTTPATVDFGTHDVGQDSGARDITVTSLGARPVTFSAASIVGQDETAFSLVSNGCQGRTLQRGEQCTVSVSATPHAARKLVARLKLQDDTYRGQRGVPLEVAGGPDPAWAFDWGPAGTASRDRSWSEAGALGVTDATTPRLQVAFVSPWVGGRWATDRGPYVGIYHSRKATAATRWTTATRLNPASQHGGRAALAASGPGVYVAWVSLRKYVDYGPKAPRVLYVRRNLSEGSASGWQRTVRLTSLSGRVDYPAIAADGPNVYLTWTDSVTGKLLLAISRDSGRTWAKQVLGTTSSRNGSGYWGAPSVAVDASHVIVTWWAKMDTTVKARVSRDGGATFDPATIIGHASWRPAVDAREGRLAVLLPLGEELWLRLYEDGAWASRQEIPRFHETKPQASDVVLRGKHGVGIAFPACKRNCYFSTRTQTESRLLWRYSTDDGESWSRATTLGGSARYHMANDSPSLAWPPGGQRAVIFEGWTWGTDHFRVYVAQGSAIDPASAGPAADLTVAGGSMPAYPDLERVPGRPTRD